MRFTVVLQGRRVRVDLMVGGTTARDKGWLPESRAHSGPLVAPAATRQPKSHSCTTVGTWPEVPALPHTAASSRTRGRVPAEAYQGGQWTADVRVFRPKYGAPQLKRCAPKYVRQTLGVYRYYILRDIVNKAGLYFRGVSYYIIFQYSEL